MVVKQELTRNLLGIEKWQKTEAVRAQKRHSAENHCWKVVSRIVNAGSVEREFQVCVEIQLRQWMAPTVNGHRACVGDGPGEKTRAPR